MICIEEKFTRKLPGLTSLFITSNYNEKYIEICKNCYCAVFHKDDKTWEVPITNLAYILDQFSAYDNIELKLLKQSSDDVNIPTLDTNSYTTKLFKHQEDAIKYGLIHDKWLLLDAPGLGKTATTIYLAKELADRGLINKCLVICGINTLKSNWKKEIQKHSNLSAKILGERINRKGIPVIDGIATRVKQLSNPFDEFFCITNIETLRSDDIIKQINNGPNKFDLIIFDECHKAKDPGSIQGKNLLRLNKAQYKIGLTGTLLLNNPLDAYTALKWIGAEKSNYSTCKHFYMRYGGLFNNEFLGYQNLDILKQQIDSISLRRGKELLDLPPKIIIDEFIDMNDAQADFYNNIKQGIIDQIDQATINPAGVLNTAIRLRQATALPQILTSETIESSKINRAIELVDEIISNGNKCIIFSTFKPPIYYLEEKLKQYNPVLGTGDLDDFTIARNQDLFQTDSNTKLFLGTWQKCGTGLTLTAANYMIFIDTPYTAGSYIQAQDRIYRIGTKDTVFIYNLICKNTFDERVLELLQDKSLISDYIIDDKINPNLVSRLQQLIRELA